MFGTKKTNKTISDLDSFLDHIDECVLTYKNGIKNYLEGNKVEFDSNQESISKLRESTLELRRTIENDLYTYSLVTDQRVDIMQLLERINTEMNERSPFLHTDSKTLYFSSNGHEGLGGQDIFYSKMDEKRRWAAPVNIGYPINTENDEVDFFVSLDGKTGYFSSNNYGDQDWNIYQFELYEEARPHTMVIVKGKVTVDEGNLENAVVEIRDTNANVVSTGIVSASTGSYAVAAEVHHDDPQPLIVNVKKEGYSFDTQIIKPEEITEEIVEKDAEVKAVETGKVCDLRDIYYETNDFSLTQESKMLLSLFIEFLNENPTVKVEIQGHTDNIGRDDDNLLLSENRAKSVYEYVIGQGISANRLRYKGYGESNPIADNNTAEGRAKNRRTVFLIYEK